MKTKQIPIIITLLAAGITCLVSAIQDVSFSVYTKRLFIAVICFALIGTGIKIQRIASPGKRQRMIAQTRRIRQTRKKNKRRGQTHR